MAWTWPPASSTTSGRSRASGTSSLPDSPVRSLAHLIRCTLPCPSLKGGDNSPELVEEAQVGTASGEDGVDLVAGGDVPCGKRGDLGFVADPIGSGHAEHAPVVGARL